MELTCSLQAPLYLVVTSGAKGETRTKAPKMGAKSQSTTKRAALHVIEKARPNFTLYTKVMESFQKLCLLQLHLPLWKRQIISWLGGYKPVSVSQSHAQRRAFVL